MRIERLRLHFFDIDNFAIGADEGDRQRNQRIFHPHAYAFGLTEQEYHAVVGAELFAEHQALFALARAGGDLGVDDVDADGELGVGEGFALLGEGAGGGDQQDGSGKRAGQVHGGWQELMVSGG